MRNLLLIFSFCFFGTNVYSQKNEHCDSTTIAKEGSFEIIKKIQTEALNTPKEVLPIEVLCLIEKSRLQNENVILNFEKYNIVIFARDKKKKQ